MEFLKGLQMGGNAIREPLVGMKNLKTLCIYESVGKPRDEWGLLRLFGIRKSHEPCWRLVLSSLNHLRCLEEIRLCNCDLGEGDIPHDIGDNLSSLRILDLRGNNFITLPASINCLSRLVSLRLNGCQRLEQLPDLPSNSKLHVIVDNCTSLKRLSDPSKLSSRFANIYDFTFSSLNCITLVEDEDWMNTISSRIVKFASKGICRSLGHNYIVCPGKGIPEWFNNQTVGHSLNVELPPQSCSSWMGIAFCVVFAKKNYPYYSFEIKCLPGISCCISATEHMVSEHLWIFYLSREQCQEQFSFETCYIVEGNEPNMVKMCGARLVYKQDLEELNQTLKILKRTHGYCEEAAPSESGSFDDKEQAHKRQKEE
ncbi:disease resistance-like protein DSC1 isoform X2 [Pyrus x bretschneideri]|nr:disease resistance-like protein DSC1 isoform X2 [Pyrus x bretschneideri]